MLKKKFWKISTITLLILLILTLIFNPFHKEKKLTEQEIEEITENFLSNYILGPHNKVEIKSIEEKDNFYKLDIYINNEQSISYITKDGTFFFPLGMNIYTIEQTAKYNEYFDMNISNNPILGNAEAPVTLISYIDYQCPDSIKFLKEFFPKIKSTFIQENRIKYIQKNYPITRLHQFSLNAAKASECAFNQNKFWEYNEILIENSPALTQENLLQYAKDLNLNIEKFKNCLETTNNVEKDIEDGNRINIINTPTFLINGRKVYNIQEFEVLGQIIEDEFGKAVN